MKKGDENLRFLCCNFFSKNRGGQITIFVIAAVLIVAIVGLFFLFRTGLIENLGIGGNKETNVNEFFSLCIEDKVKEGIEEISLVGGYPSSELYVKFLFTEENVARNIPYLCYTQNNFRPCVVQKPTLFVDFQDEEKNFISSDIGSCFSEMKNSFRKNGFEVSSESVLNDFDVKFMPDRVVVKTDSKIVLTKADETTTRENFEIQVPSDIYALLGIAQEIVNSQAQFCYFEETGFQVTYPDYSIEKHLIDSGNMIYTIENKKTEEKFRFAVRSCSIPPGF